MVALDGPVQQTKWVDDAYVDDNVDPPLFSNFDVPYGGAVQPTQLVFSSITRQDDKCLYGVGKDGVEGTDDDTEFYVCSSENINAYHMQLNATITGNTNPAGLHFFDDIMFYVWPKDPCYETEMITYQPAN